MLLWSLPSEPYANGSLVDFFHGFAAEIQAGLAPLLLSPGHFIEEQVLLWTTPVPSSLGVEALPKPLFFLFIIFGLHLLVWFILLIEVLIVMVGPQCQGGFISLFRPLEYRFNIIKPTALNIGSFGSSLELQRPPWGTWDMGKTMPLYSTLAWKDSKIPNIQWSTKI